MLITEDDWNAIKDCVSEDKMEWQMYRIVYDNPFINPPQFEGLAGNLTVFF